MTLKLLNNFFWCRKNFNLQAKGKVLLLKIKKPIKKKRLKNQSKEEHIRLNLRRIGKPT